MPSPEQNLSTPPPKRRARLPLWAFLLAVLFVCTALYSIPQIVHRNHRFPRSSGLPEYRYSQTLADSTRYWINDGSGISFQGLPHAPVREMDLKGEGYFIIAKTDTPFLLHSPTMDVKANGATVDVNDFPTDKLIEASVFQGAADITLHTKPEKKFQLLSGDKLVIHTDDSSINFEKVHYDPADSLYFESAWTRYRVAACNINFEELRPRLERAFGIKFNISGIDTITQRFSFIVQQNLPHTLEVLQAVDVPFRYAIKEKEVVIRP